MATESSFEKSLEKLEKIVDDLESGDLTLDNALKKYEEGVKLSRDCQQKLSQAEQKIEVLTKSLEGDLVKKPFSDDEDESIISGKKSKKR